MDPITTSIILNVCGGILANYSTEVIKRFFSKAIELDPSLEPKIQQIRSYADVDEVFRQAVGVIDANAGTGVIDVDAALLTALRGIRFDHAQGTVMIDGSTITAPVIQFGGNVGSTGQTTITNTESKTSGTSIKVHGNAHIQISENARIRQE